MKLCKEGVQVEEYVILVAEATDLYTHLRFALLASTWLPRSVGVCLWSLLHAILVLHFALLHLTKFIALFLLAVLGDAIIFLSSVVCVVLAFLFFLLGAGVLVAFGWMWLLLTCRCCVMGGRAPGQSVGQYVLSLGATFAPQTTPGAAQPPAPVEEADRWDSVIRQTYYTQTSFVMRLARQTKLVSAPYWRLSLVDLCLEIVPLYDAIVI